MLKTLIRHAATSAVLLGLSLLPSAARAQSGVSVIPSVVLAFEATDDLYHSPYLSEPLGGFAWGGSVAVLGQRQRLVFGGEIDSVRMSKVLEGRLVSTEQTDHSPRPTPYVFQETFVSGIVGGTNANRTFQYLGGAGVTLGRPEAQDRSYDNFPGRHWVVLTGGANWLGPRSARVKFVFGVRYHYILRGDTWQTFGLDNQSFRVQWGLGLGSR